MLSIYKTYCGHLLSPKGGDNPKHVGAQQLMQGNIAVKFEGAWPYGS